MSRVMQRCETCLGRKTVLGFGNMPTECFDCKGEGYLLLVDPAAEDSQEFAKEIKKVKAKK